MNTIPMSNFRLLECLVGHDRYCFQSQHVAGVLQGAAARAELPSCSEIAGVVHYGGQETPVLHLRRILGYPDGASAERRHIVIIRNDQSHFGILVDSVLGAREVAREQIAPLPSIAWNPAKPYFEGVVAFGIRSAVRVSDRVAHSPIGHAGESEMHAALLIYPTGLLDEEVAAQPGSWSGTPLDIATLQRQQQSRHGQIMVFDVPETSSAQLPTALALSISQVLEVVQRTKLIRVPGAPTTIEGLIPWRKQFVPVVDLSHVLGLTRTRFTAATRLVVVRNSRNQLLAFYSSSDVRTLRLPIDAKPCSFETSADSSWLRGTFQTKEGVLVLPDLDRFLAI